MNHSAKQSVKIKILIGLVVVLLLGAIGFVIWCNKATQEDYKSGGEDTETEVVSETTSTTDNFSPAPAPTSDEVFRPSADMVENIADILNTLNTQPFEGYVADEVTLYYASAKPATTLTDKTEIADTLQYFDDAETPWDLSLPKSDIDRYKSKFPDLFGDDCLAGHSADANRIVSFCFSREGKIHSILLCREPQIFN